MRAGADSGFIIEIMPQGHKALATRAGRPTRRHSRCHMEITSKPGTGMGPASGGCVLWPMRRPQCKKAQMAREVGGGEDCAEQRVCRARDRKQGGWGTGKGRQHMLRSAQGTGAAVRFLRISAAASCGPTQEDIEDMECN